MLCYSQDELVECLSTPNGLPGDLPISIISAWNVPKIINSSLNVPVESQVEVGSPNVIAFPDRLETTNKPKRVCPNGLPSVRKEFVHGHGS